MAEVGSKVEPSAKKAPVEADVAAPAVKEDKPEIQATEKVAAAPAEAAAPAAAEVPVAAKAAPAKRAAAKKSVKPARSGKVAKPAKKVPAAAKPAAKKSSKHKPAKQPVAAIPAPSKPSIVSILKEKNMPKTAKNPKIVEEIQQAVTKAQAQAKKMVEKGSGLLGEASEFTKGNVEAVAESGKILAGGFKALGQDMVADTRDTLELVKGEVKDLAAVKSPTELVKVQGEILRKNLDTTIALGSKNSQAMLKLAGEVFAPISGRFTLAAEKLRKPAA
jgi:hypothetical protein